MGVVALDARQPGAITFRPIPVSVLPSMKPQFPIPANQSVALGTEAVGAFGRHFAAVNLNVEDPIGWVMAIQAPDARPVIESILDGPVLRQFRVCLTFPMPPRAAGLAVAVQAHPLEERPFHFRAQS